MAACALRLLLDGAGRPARALGVVSDETERRRAARRRAASERGAAPAREPALGAGVWDRDLLTGEVVWSEEEFSLLAWTPRRGPSSTLPPGGMLSSRRTQSASRNGSGRWSATAASSWRFPRPAARRAAALDPDACQGRARCGRADAARNRHQDRRDRRARAGPAAGGAQHRAVRRGGGAAARAGAPLRPVERPFLGVGPAGLSPVGQPGLDAASGIFRGGAAGAPASRLHPSR
jgi:hypothetical protein